VFTALLAADGATAFDWEAKANWRGCPNGEQNPCHEFPGIGRGSTQDAAKKAAMANCQTRITVDIWKRFCRNEPVREWDLKKINCDQVLSPTDKSHSSPGKSWITCTGHALIFRKDGNLVFQDGNGNQLWESRTSGSRADKLSMQVDGNLVLYRRKPKPQKAIWCTNTAGNRGARLVVYDGGRFAIVNRQKVEVFKSDSPGITECH